MTEGRPAPPAKFQHPELTADGQERAQAPFDRLETLWLNTGTLCNIECAHCYIESSPTNDRLDYLTAGDARPFLDEALSLGAEEIGFTGGEPFMNPEFLLMIRDALGRGFRVLVLTNAMRPMARPRIREELVALKEAFGGKLTLRVSLDHFDAARHDEERGPGAFAATLEGIDWLAVHGFRLAVAGRKRWGEEETMLRAGFSRLFSARRWPIDALDLRQLVLFPEMDETADVPEITTACWDILHKSPASVMCASSRMVVKRKGAAAPVVVACTLIPYSAAFELGARLKDALSPVRLNHPHCAKFCVLGGARCSA